MYEIQKQIRDQYILNRWTIEARNEVVRSMNETNVVDDKKIGYR